MNGYSFYVYMLDAVKAYYNDQPFPSLLKLAKAEAEASAEAKAKGG
jgi:hypothetical protein